MKTYVCPRCMYVSLTEGELHECTGPMPDLSGQTFDESDLPKLDKPSHIKRSGVREWWIKWPACVITEPREGYIHVIEHSAYEQLKQERDALKAERDRALNHSPWAKLDEILSYMPSVPTEPYERQMAQEILRLRGALERIADLPNKYETHLVARMQGIAREALK